MIKAKIHKNEENEGSKATVTKRSKSRNEKIYQKKKLE
jgi:hypothetical protein